MPEPAHDAPAPRPPWHERPLGVIVITIGIILGSSLAAWLVSLVHWYTWQIGSYDHALSHEANYRAFYDSPACTIVASIALQGSAVVLALVFVQARNPDRPSPPDLWVTRPTLRPRYWPIVILGTFGVIFAAGYMSQLLQQLGLLPASAPDYDAHYAAVAQYRGAWALLSVTAMSLTAGIGEELVFRGYTLKALLRSWTPARAIIFSSLLFAASHRDVLYAASVLPAGLWFGYIACRTRSIVLAATAHALLDFYGIGRYVVPPELLEHKAGAAADWAIFIVGCLCVVPAIWLLERRSLSPNSEAPGDRLEGGTDGSHAQ